MKLTRVNVERLALPAGVNDRIVFDDGLPGFGLRIRDGGKRTWIVQYRVGAKQRRVTLGTVETLNADEARKRARNALSKVHLGHDPQLEKGETRTQAAITLASIAERYLEVRAANRLKPKTLAEVTRSLRDHWKPLHLLPLAKVARVNIAGELGRIAKEHGPIAANRSRAYLSTLYAWAIGEGLADANPVIGTNKSGEEVSRDRVLSGNEVGLIWRHAGAGQYGAIVRLLLLTGQRREEVAAMRWPELDLDKGFWALPASRTKNARPHDVPLSQPTIEILQDQVRQPGREFVFGEGTGPFQGWSKAKSALDNRLQEAGMTAPWRLHDLRRTAATGMANLGVQPHVVEAVLNHASGHKAGVAGVYNRSSYAAEKSAALTLWASHVMTLVEGETDDAEARGESTESAQAGLCLPQETRR
jgi:integrase